MATLPPWLQAARTGPMYAQGVGYGLQAAQQRIAAAQRAQALAAQMQAQQQDALIAQQRMAVQQELARQEAALKQQEIGLSAEVLAARRAKDQADIDEVTQMRSAQAEYQRRVAAGEPPEQVMMEMGPSLGQGADMGSAFRYMTEMEKLSAKPELQAGPVQGQPILGPEGKAIPGMVAVPSATGTGYTVHPVRPEQAELTRFQRETLVDRMQRQIDKLQEDNPDIGMTEADPAWTARRKSAWQRARKSLEAIEARMSALEQSPAAAAPQAALPLPKTKDALVEGQLYQTKYGPMEWNGDKFVRPSTSTGTFDEER